MSRTSALPGRGGSKVQLLGRRENISGCGRNARLDRRTLTAMVEKVGASEKYHTMEEDRDKEKRVKKGQLF